MHILILWLKKIDFAKFYWGCGSILFEEETVSAMLDTFGNIQAWGGKVVLKYITGTTAYHNQTGPISWQRKDQDRPNPIDKCPTESQDMVERLIPCKLATWLGDGTNWQEILSVHAASEHKLSIVENRL